MNQSPLVLPRFECKRENKIAEKMLCFAPPQGFLKYFKRL
ncbi:hypothetical protein CBM2599_B51381 [Cupriavidus taiwanensis]|nr:hypothetical protein CBM2599_B51381 [Cupriavidus taiwanensis]SOZ00377.1 hypothetical protein CBM2600_B70391 [Cupriavidus taiwanensis]